MKKMKIFFLITEFLLFISSFYVAYKCTNYNLLEPFFCNNSTMIMIILLILFIINSFIIFLLD